MRRTVVAAATWLWVAAGYADITAGHCLWQSGTLPESGDSFYTFRLFVDVTGPGGMPDDWIEGRLDLDVTGGVLYQHSFGGSPSSPALFPHFPDLAYDSYYSSPADYPNRDYDGAIVGIVRSDDADTRLDTDWFDVVDSGDGESVIAQITVLPHEPDWVATGLLMYTSRETGTALFPYRFVLTPEPGTVNLLVLAGLAAVRCRGWRRVTWTEQFGQPTRPADENVIGRS